MFGRRSRRLIAAENAARAAALEAGTTGSSHPDARVAEAASHGAAQGVTGSANVSPAASPAPVAEPVIELSEERVFAAVLERLQDFVGENGSWTLTRRSDSDTEVFFHDMAALSLARAVTSTLVDAAGHGASTGSARRDELSALDQVHATSDTPAIDGDPTGDASVATANPERAVSPVVRTIMELDTIAVWADPKSHDPAYIDERMLRPETAPTADADRANGQRRA